MSKCKSVFYGNLLKKRDVKLIFTVEQKWYISSCFNPLLVYNSKGVLCTKKAYVVDEKAIRVLCGALSCGNGGAMRFKQRASNEKFERK